MNRSFFPFLQDIVQIRAGLWLPAGMRDTRGRWTIVKRVRFRQRPRWQVKTDDAAVVGMRPMSVNRAFEFSIASGRQCIKNKGSALRRPFAISCPCQRRHPWCGRRRRNDRRQSLPSEDDASRPSGDDAHASRPSGVGTSRRKAGTIRHTTADRGTRRSTR